MPPLRLHPPTTPAIFSRSVLGKALLGLIHTSVSSAQAHWENGWKQKRMRFCFPWEAAGLSGEGFGCISECSLAEAVRNKAGSHGFTVQAVFPVNIHWWDGSFCILVPPVPSHHGCLRRMGRHSHPHQCLLYSHDASAVFAPGSGFCWAGADTKQRMGCLGCLRDTGSAPVTAHPGKEEVVRDGETGKCCSGRLRVWWMRLCCGCLQYSPFHPPHTICSWQNSCDIKESLHFHWNAAALDYSAVINGRKIPGAF